MSMLSSMTEKMRKTADKVERFGRRNSDWLWRDGTTITRAVVELRDAADTIDHLRNTCNDLQFENEKLRESYDSLRNAMWDRANARAIDFMTEDELRGLCADLYGHIDELKDLVRDAWGNGHPDKSCEGCELTDKCHESMDELHRCYFEVSIERRMSEMGIEVY